MVIVFGSSFRLSASVEVIIRSLSILIKGREAGLEPVAMITFLVVISFSSSPEIRMVFLSLNEPVPV